MNITKIAERHTNQPMKQHSIKQARKLISAITTQLDSKLETAISKYRRELARTTIDRTLSDGVKRSIINDAEYEVLAAHEIIGSLTNALDEVKNKWDTLEKYIKSMED
jgi:ribosomal protein L29